MAEQLGGNPPDGTVAPGLHQEVIITTAATRQLRPDESGSLCVFNSLTGVVYTLPTPVLGMSFDLMPMLGVTSNAYKVITKTIASEFILGTVFGYTTDATEIDGFSANGSTHVAIASDGGATGGDLGGRYTLTAISTTQWLITGNVFCGTTTPTTPFATS